MAHEKDHPAQGGYGADVQAAASAHGLILGPLSSGGAAPAGGSSGSVYMGFRSGDVKRTLGTKHVGDNLIPITQGTPSGSRVLSVDAANALFVGWGTGEDIKRLQRKLIAAGKWSGVVDGIPTPELRLAWEAVVSFAATYPPSARMSPWDLLDLWASSPNTAGAAGAGGAPTNTTTTSVNLTDPTTARGFIESTMETQLGRAPKPHEIDEFVAALNAAESGNPNVTRAKNDGAGNQDFTSSGGISPPDYADQYTQAGELGREANTYAAGTKHYGALLSVLGLGGMSGA